MEKEEIKERLTVIFREVFEDEEIVLADEQTAEDIENWDSLSHMMLIAAIEKDFAFKFKLKQLSSLGSVGGIISAIEANLEQS